MRIKQSLCFPMLGLREASPELDSLFGQAAKIGFPAVEFWHRGGDFDQIVSLARKHGLAISAIAGHGSIPMGLNDPAEHDRIERELRGSIDVAAENNIASLICFAGNRREGLTDEAAIDIVVEGFSRIAGYAERKGVTLILELLNTKVDHPGYMGDRTAWGVEVCKRVNSPRVKLLYDIYHMQIMEGDVIRTITGNIDWIGHFHAAGVPGRNDPDATQELNYRAIAAAIAATNYDGYFGWEFRPKGEIVPAIRAAFECVNV